MLKLIAVAEKDEERLHQLQAARIKRAKIAEAARPERAIAPEPATPLEPARPIAQPDTPETAPPSVALSTSQNATAPSAKDEARAIREYARVNKISYQAAWTLFQRAKKAAQAAAAQLANQPIPA